MYLTLSVGTDVARAHRRLDAYLLQYYGQPAAVVRDRQECYAGAPSGLDAYLTGYALRFAGEHEQHLETVAAVRARL